MGATIAYYVGDFVGRLLMNRIRFLIFPSVLLTSTYISYYSYKKIRKAIKKKNIKKLADSINIERDRKIEEFLEENVKYISDERIEYITNLTACEIVDKIKDKSLNVNEVILAFIIKSGTIGKDNKYISDTNFEYALERAKELGNILKTNLNKGLQLPSLIGLPISLNDQIAVKGLLTTIGYTSLHKNMDQEDSYVTKVLLNLGCIPFVKSNTPQAGFSFDTQNEIWGTVTHPLNKNKSIGGGSGGEAGLITSNCSPIGLGVDIIGGIRIPAALCGLYSFKPTSTRISNLGVYSISGNKNISNCFINQSIGPITKSIQDIKFICTNLFGEFREDGRCNNVNYSDDITYNKTFKIAYFIDHPLCETAPVIKNTIDDIIQNLELKGYQTFEFPIKKFTELIEIGNKLFANSEFDFIKQTLHGEEPQLYLKDLLSARRMNKSIRKIIHFIRGNIRSNIIYSRWYTVSRYEMMKLAMSFQELRQEFLNFCKENQIFSFITPVLPTPSIDLNMSQLILPFNHFVFLFNILDMPAGTVPIKVCKQVDYVSKFKDEFSAAIKTSVTSSAQLPLSIQVATLPNQDELCIEMMKLIDDLFKFNLKDE